MLQCDRSTSFMSLDCGLHSVEDATVSQLVLFVSMLEREGCVIPEFVSKNDIMVDLCTTQAQVHLKLVTALNDAEHILEFEEGT